MVDKLVLLGIGLRKLVWLLEEIIKIILLVIPTLCLSVIIMWKDLLIRIVPQSKKCPLNVIKNVEMTNPIKTTNIKLNPLIVLKALTLLSKIFKVMDL